MKPTSGETESERDMYTAKMHGLGNTFVLKHGEPPENADKLAREICAAEQTDGLIFIHQTSGEENRLSMRIFNSDGSEAEMCGNGIRCAARFALDCKMAQGDVLFFDTKAGERVVRVLSEGMYSVDMGEGAVDGEMKLCAAGGEVCPVIVNMGNPHAVIFVPDAEKADVETVGREVCFSPAFPEGTNVEFVSVRDAEHVRMRVWERGCGITKACGTGACASVCAAAYKGYTDAKTPVSTQLDGGILEIFIDARGHVIMRGPAEYMK